jgi:GntR family transcriptional repressor for pyruvate dehydrogenase complex
MEELQNALDHEAVKNAMERGTIQEKGQLVATATEMVRLASDNLYSHVLDRSFHDSLYKIGRNNAIEQMINKIRSYRFIQQEDSQNGNDSIWLATIPQHLALAQALKDCKLAAAIQAIDEINEYGFKIARK